MDKKIGKLFIVSGPPGVGKTTIVKEAVKRLAGDLDISKIVTYTTRPKRENETPDKDYVFLKDADFDKKESEKFFLETNKYLGHRYGSPMPDQGDIDAGKSFILVVDLEGSKSSIKAFRDSVSVWIDPPSIDILKNRLEKRGSEKGPKLEKRIEKAKLEIEEANKIRLFDYKLVNDNFDQAVSEFMMLVKKSFNEE